MKYVVVNPAGVRERTAPNTSSYSARTHPAGVILEIVEPVIPVGENEKWGMIEGKYRAFVAISVGEKIYCSPVGKIENPDNWMHAVDAWLRTKGYKGPKP